MFFLAQAKTVQLSAACLLAQIMASGDSFAENPIWKK